MKAELANYKVTPKVFQADVSTTVTIRPRGNHARFDDTKSYLVRFIPMEQSVEPLNDEAYQSVNVTPKDGILTFTHSFSGEQMHLIRVIGESNTIEFTVFSLLPDLYARRPYKGDLHVHSYYSDGREDPGVVVANYRKKGYDFMAITDHNEWFPSKEAIDRYKDIPTDIKLFYGEEIHVHGRYIHAVNFGGTHSVNDYYYANEQTCTDEVNELAKALTVPEGVNLLDYAKRVWIANKIRESGGLAIFVHPHWMNNAYNVPDKTSEYIFEQGIYDAFEVLGGQTVFENNMQIAMYNEQRARGRVIPIVGSSDSHGTEPAHWFELVYTIAFSEGDDLENFKDAIKGLYSVAVENYPTEEKRVQGTYRMVKYGMFLINEYFPLYEELCYEQGRAMKDCVTGYGEINGSVEVLKAIKGRTDRFADEFFGR